ncbi:MAG: SMP-30/gluconolactonase/LRE family protein [Candidatus Cloacimonetes bacterium]|nr:SMP-30/gluconolactonase/LRE family protein [Candidatus Cloacimonadota bacterium]
MKRKYILLLILVFAAMIAVFVWYGLKSPLQGPESIAFDSVGKRFLISNVKGGSITSMTLAGKHEKFLSSGMQSPRGIVIKDGNLFIADDTNIKIVDIESAKLSDTIPIPDAKLLNDLVFDKTGKLFITDTKASCLFMLNVSTKKAEKIISPLLKAPNGIVYDMPRDQMFIVGQTKQSSILSLSLIDNSVRVFMDTMYSDLDGIAIDDLGRIYISSWAEKMIFEIPQEQNRFIAKYKNMAGAADIYYYLPNNELIVPLLTSNKIVRVSLD